MKEFNIVNKTHTTVGIHYDVYVQLFQNIAIDSIIDILEKLP